MDGSKSNGSILARCLAYFLFLALGSGWTTSWLVAQEPADAIPTASFQESLESMGSLPWYDADAGTIEPVDVKPRVDDSTNRESRWIPKPKKPKETKAKSGSSSRWGGSSQTNTPGFWGSLSTVLSEFSQVLGWLLLALAMAAVIGMLVYAFNKMEYSSSGGTTVSQSIAELDESDEARLENLPMQVQRPTGDLLAEADRLLSLGYYSEAIVYLFGHRLLQLDRAHAIRLARGKTNRQYLNELRPRVELRRIMIETVQLFEQSYFGRYEISKSQFDATRGQQAKFESHLEAQKEAA